MLIALLIAISLGVWFQSFRIFEREPRAQQIAMQVVSVVKLTRAALLYSDPTRRRFLLLDLVQNESRSTRVSAKTNTASRIPTRTSHNLCSTRSVTGSAPRR